MIFDFLPLIIDSNLSENSFGSHPPTYPGGGQIAPLVHDYFVSEAVWAIAEGKTEWRAWGLGPALWFWVRVGLKIAFWLQRAGNSRTLM
jgi:hypothetical protein